MFPRARHRPLRGPQAVLAIMVLSLAYWGSVAWLVGLRTEVIADQDVVVPDDEADEAPLEQLPLEPARPSYPRVLGLAYGTPPMVLTNRPALRLCDQRDRSLGHELHLIRPQREEP
jgi:hypothetical protein